MIEEDRFDCRQQAEAAMRMAIAESGHDREIWLRVALLWQALLGDGMNDSCGNRERELS